MRREEAEQSARSIARELGWPLADDWDLARVFLTEDGLSLDLLGRTLAAMPPLVDVEALDLVDPLMGSGGPGEEIPVPLRTVDGPTGVELLIRLKKGKVALVGFRGPAPSPVAALPGKRADGKLPRERFVGSPWLRTRRLLNALPGELEEMARGGSEQHDAWALSSSDADIYNGSLFQFYSNSTGDFAPRFPAFAEKVGAVEKAAVVATANEIFDGIDLDSREARGERLDGLSEEEEASIEEATDRYYEAEEDITDLLAAYVEANPRPFLA